MTICSFFFFHRQQAFEVWLEFGEFHNRKEKKEPPAQLPVVLQVFVLQLFFVTATGVAKPNTQTESSRITR